VPIREILASVPYRANVHDWDNIQTMMMSANGSHAEAYLKLANGVVRQQLPPWAEKKVYQGVGLQQTTHHAASQYQVMSHCSRG
jgi:hypothetical protein